MNNRGSGASAFMVGAGVGAGLMALLDPSRGAARRSFLRDKVFRAVHIGQREMRKLMKEIANEVRGSIAEQRARMREGDIADVRLLARVRAQIGHVVENFGALELTARDGHVTVWGPVLMGEKQKIEERLRQTRGVKTCYVQVSEHEDLSELTGSLKRDVAEPVDIGQARERAS